MRALGMWRRDWQEQRLRSLKPHPKLPVANPRWQWALGLILRIPRKVLRPTFERERPRQPGAFRTLLEPAPLFGMIPQRRVPMLRA